MIFTPEELKEIYWAVAYAFDILQTKIEIVNADLKMEPTPELQKKIKLLESAYKKLEILYLKDEK